MSPWVSPLPQVQRSTGPQSPQSPIITSLVNCSLTLEHFPVRCKGALVDPRLKKPRQSASHSNLRPVRNLQFISKLMERAVYNQTQEHLVRSELYPTLQSAYRAGHSTETALLKVHNDMLLNMDNQRVTQLVLFDLSSAFNTVDHKVLLRRLEITFGIADTALQWFRSYLAGRSQRVLLNGSFSEDFSLPHGVPQGYCLGTLLFTIYASKLFVVVKRHLPDVYTDDNQHTYTGYADDNQLHISFKPGSSASELEAVTASQDCILHIKTWMTADKLKLNDDKTELIVIGTRAQLDKISISELSIDHVKVSAVCNVRNLGTWFDNHLSMKTAINKTCNSGLCHLHNIGRIKRFLSFKIESRLFRQ